MSNKLQGLLCAIVFMALSAPPAALAQKPEEVFFERLTFDEIRDLLRGGARNVIVATGGTEGDSRHLVLGAHNDVVAYAANEIARALGGTLIAPVIAYAPSSAIESPSISLPEDGGYRELLEATANSLKGGGFNNIIFIGNSSGSQAGMKAAAEKIDAVWKEAGVRVFYIADYYVKSRADQGRYIMEKLGVQPAETGVYADIIGASEVLAVNAKQVRLNKLEDGDPDGRAGGGLGKATPQLGRVLLKIKIDNAVAQIRRLIASGGDQEAQ